MNRLAIVVLIAGCSAPGSEDGANRTHGGWRCDEPSAPTRIVLCPATCSMVNGDAEGRVHVELGCLTFIT